jgi:hypothetical protein
MKHAVATSFSVDGFLDREQSKGYNCLDFTREVWLAMTGEDLAERLPGLANAFRQRRRPVKAVKGFRLLAQPVAPCLVVMQRSRFVPHIGIYFEDRILHLTDRGVQFQPLIVARQYFLSVKYYV